MLLTTWMAIAAWGSGAELGAVQACEEGVSEACRLAAEAYVSGDGVEIDVARAVELFGEACLLGSGESCIHLAERYRDGTDVVADVQQSAQWYAMGCEHGLGDACRMAGDLYVRSTPEIVSDADAGAYYRLGCSHHDAESCMVVVEQLRDGERDPPEALPFLEAACETGSLDGCLRIAEQGPTSRRLRAHASACSLGHVPSCREHGIALATGSGIARDREAGRAELTVACEADDALACAALGDLLRKTDPTDALAAASRACGLGIDKSCRRAWRLRRKVER